MAVISGRAGMVGTGSDVAGIKSWTLDYTVDILDTTDFADGAATNAARTFVPGLSTWSGSFTGFKDGAPQGLGFTTAITLTLEESETATQKYSGSAWITGQHITTSVDGTVDYTYDFQGTSELTEATA